MKTKFIFLFILFVSVAYSQSEDNIISQDSLLGIWQADNNLLAAGLADTYEFWEDNTFRFNFNSMRCGLRRLWNILGSYQLLKDEIILRITATSESVGGHIEEAGTEEGESGFQIIGDRMKIIKQNEPSILHFKLNRSDTPNMSLKINGRIFYKLRFDPYNP